LNGEINASLLNFVSLNFLFSMVHVLSLISSKTKLCCPPPCLSFTCAQDVLMIKSSCDASSSTWC
jgi:hypothetical protein